MPKQRSAEWRAKIGAAHKARGVGSTSTKHCPHCNQELPREAFGHRPNGYSKSYCPPCGALVARSHDVRRVRTEAQKERTRLRATVKKYGMTIEVYEGMFAAQNGLCAICGQPPRGEANGKAPKTGDRRPATLFVDHSHDTGVIRGLLCGSCNGAIGFLNDDPAIVRAAADYLDRHGAG